MLLACKPPDNIGEEESTDTSVSDLSERILGVVYIISKSGKPLMPTERHGKVRKLLNAGKARQGWSDGHLLLFNCFTRQQNMCSL